MVHKKLKSYEHRKNNYDIYKNILEKHFINNEDLTDILYDIHNNLEYGKVDLCNLIDYYKLEYIISRIEIIQRKGIILDEKMVNFYKSLFEERLKEMLKEIELCLQVWFLRELFYIFDNLITAVEEYNAKNPDSPDWKYMSLYEIENYPIITNLSIEEINKFIKLLFHNNSDEIYKLFNPFIISIADDYYSISSVSGYLKILKNYNYSFKLQPQARFNYLLNLAHNNGNMATKFIHHNKYTIKKKNILLNDKKWYKRKGQVEERILTSLSEGHLIRYAELEFKNNFKINNLIEK